MRPGQKGGEFTMGKSLEELNELATNHTLPHERDRMNSDRLTGIKTACCKHNSSVNHIQTRDLSLVAAGLMTFLCGADK
jgi:hypothetical protein